MNSEASASIEAKHDDLVSAQEESIHAPENERRPKRGRPQGPKTTTISYRGLVTDMDRVQCLVARAELGSQMRKSAGQILREAMELYMVTQSMDANLCLQQLIPSKEEPK
jgi:hypothetical protein